MDEHRLGFDEKFWEIHKFGGTSVASASCFLKVASIIEEQIGIIDNKGSFTDTHKNLAVVVSAMGGKPKVTDLLLDAVSFAALRDEAKTSETLDLIFEKHQNCVDALSIPSEELLKTIRNDINDIRDILKTVSLMKWKANRISELVSGYGEQWSSQILTALLTKRSEQRSKEEKNLSIDSFLVQDDSIHHFCYLDARRVITIDEDAIKDGAVMWTICQEKMKKAYKEEKDAIYGGRALESNEYLHFVITGYIASNIHGVATTLQRDGSDYSASIMGRILRSSVITIWTDVDGVLSADPRRVPDSYVLPEVSYNEAMELAYFGAKVIHPKTMQPAIMCEPQIPIFIRNTFNSSFRGSRIFTSSTTHLDRERCVCGFSSIERMAIINVEGSGMVGVKGVARRLFGTLESVGVNVVLISQASSEHSITIAISMKQATDAANAIEEEFHKELKQNHISKVEVIQPCSIIAAVGDGMHLTSGVSGRFFTALGDAKINILALSQGANERNISAVVLEEESTRALRAVHAAFRLSHTNVRVGIIGMNEIGMSLLKLLETQRKKLQNDFEIDLQVCAVLRDGESVDTVVLENSNGGVYADSISILEYDALTGGSLLLGATASETASENSSAQVPSRLEQSGLETFKDWVFSQDCAHTIIFDCTADRKVGSMHIEWMKMGINVVTANNSSLSGDKQLRKQIRDLENSKKVHLLREVTVGGGLPVISTLRNLLSSGDKIRRIVSISFLNFNSFQIYANRLIYQNCSCTKLLQDGIFSVTLSYVMYRIAPPPGVSDCKSFDEKSSLGVYHSPIGDRSKPCTFSQAVKEAIALGLTEEDPISDLNNEYTARVLMVLATELGIDGNLDVNTIQHNSDSLVDMNIKKYSDIESSLDEKMSHRVARAAETGCVPRHISSIDVTSDNVSSSIVDVPQNHIFATTFPSCECVRFFTERHKTYPLIVQGPSAGADSTASALLAEVLNLMKNKISSKSGVISKSVASGLNFHS